MKVRFDGPARLRGAPDGIWARCARCGQPIYALPLDEQLDPEIVAYCCAEHVPIRETPAPRVRHP